MWFIVISQTKHDSNVAYCFSDPTNVGSFVSLPLSLPPQTLPNSTLSQRTVMNGKQDVLQQPEANTDLLYFWALRYYKSSVETNFPILLSHFRTCLDDKSARNHQPKSCVPEKSHKNHNDARPILFQLKSSLPFSLFLFV